MLLDMSTRNVTNDALVGVLDVGSGAAKVRVYSGTPPGSAGAPATGSLLAEFDLPSPVFNSTDEGSAVANSIADSQGLADGSATYFRALDGDGTTRWQGSAGGPGSEKEMILSSATVTTGVNLSVLGWTVNFPEGSA